MPWILGTRVDHTIGIADVQTSRVRLTDFWKIVARASDAGLRRSYWCVPGKTLHLPRAADGSQNARFPRRFWAEMPQTPRELNCKLVLVTHHYCNQPYRSPHSSGCQDRSKSSAFITSLRGRRAHSHELDRQPVVELCDVGSTRHDLNR